MPAPLHQPFWYDEEGCGDLLEIPTHAWHDNVLTGQHGLVSWPPTLPWDYPTKMPTDAQGVYEAYAPGIEHTAGSGLVAYVPTFHPWSIYRIDNQAGHIGMLLDHAAGRPRHLLVCPALRAGPRRSNAGRGPAGAPASRLRGSVRGELGSPGGRRRNPDER